MTNNENLNDKTVSDIFEYIKCVDEKVMQNDKAIKFVSSLQSEQMKELIHSKSDNLQKFFEEAIKLQTEVVRNAYEEIILTLKNRFEQEIKEIEVKNIKINNQKEETLKSAYEDRLTALKESMENDCTRRLNECYWKAEAEKKELADKVYAETKNTCDNNKSKEIEEIIKWHEQNLVNKLNEQKCFLDSENQKQILEISTWNETNIQEQRKEQKEFLDNEYKNQIEIINTWHEQNLQEKLEEQKSFLEAEFQKKLDETNAWHEQNLRTEIEKLTKEAYANGKAEVESWHDQVVREKLNVQAEYYENEIKNAIQRTKNELYAEMDEAARRNEAELKLFLDYYENKIKPFKKLINMHESADRKVKEIERRIRNKINKTLGKQDKIIMPDTTYEQCQEIKEKISNEEEKGN